MTAERMPRPGSKLRRIYDAFVANPGKPIVPQATSPSSRCIRDLIDYYGMDIRIYRRRGAPGMKGQLPAEYTLVGRWRGAEYEDYIAPRFNTEV